MTTPDPALSAAAQLAHTLARLQHRASRLTALRGLDRAALARLMPHAARLAATSPPRCSADLAAFDLPEPADPVDPGSSADRAAARQQLDDFRAGP